MVLYQRRKKFKGIETITGALLSKLPLFPNHYTLASVFLILFSFYFLVKVQVLPAFIFFLTAALFDFIDGAVARYSQRTTKIGAYLDTICDRYVEGIVLLGFLFLPLPKIWLPSYVWIFLVLFGSLLTTYSKAAAKEKTLLELEFKRGLVGRGERIILISLTMILGIFNFLWMAWAIIVLAFLFNIAAIERISLIIAQAKREGK